MFDLFEEFAWVLFLCLFSMLFITMLFIMFLNQSCFLHKMPTEKQEKQLQQAIDFRDNYEQKIKEAAEYIKNKLDGVQPVFGIVLCTGLEDLAQILDDVKVIPYNNIPNFPMPTVSGHKGEILIGTLKDLPGDGNMSVVVLNGRMHYYEIADMPFNTGILQTVFPVHVLAELGVKNYFVTNTAGGLNPDYKVGDLMVIQSHISFIPNPLTGRKLDFKRVDNGKPVLRFQPMNNAYDAELRALLLKAGADYKGNMHEGTFLTVTGPSYETEAECIAFRDGLKSDAVGMSTTPEVIAARNRGMKVVGMSCITNMIAKDGSNPALHAEVKAILESAGTRKMILSIMNKFFSLYRE